MKVHWFIGFPIDKVLQFTSRNEISRAMCQLGYEVKLTAAFETRRLSLKGFSEIEYIKLRAKSLRSKLMLRWRLLYSFVTTDADFVFFAHPHALFLPFAKLFRLGQSRPKYILDIRSVPVDVSATFKGKFTLFFYKSCLKLCEHFADGITVITPALGEELLPQLNRLSDAMGIWSSGVRMEHFERAGSNKRADLSLTGKKVLIYHGVLSPNRGLQEAMEAVALLKDEIPELVFLLVGTGAGKTELEQLAGRLGIADKVVFTGKIEHEVIPLYLRSANCAILPFPNIRWWAVSSPIKLMEYLAIGLPIVATDIEAHRQVIELTGGAVLAEDNRPESLADAIVKAMNDFAPPAARDMLERVISWNSQACKLDDFLRRVSSGKAVNQCRSSDQ